MRYSFEFDPRKAAANERKHGVSFEEAQSVFNDPLAIAFPDDAHSVEEERQFLVGHSRQDRLLVVCFTVRGGEVLRIINARKATRLERMDYEQST